MKQNLRFILLTLLCAVCSVVWGAEVTITKTVNEIVDENGYTVSSGSNIGTLAIEFPLDDMITISTTGDSNCGSFWGTSTYDWRLYQNKNGNVIITAKDGYALKCVNLTFTASNGGILKDGSSTIQSNKDIAVSGKTIEFLVGNSGSATNGQIRITQFSVTYDVASSKVDPEVYFDKEFMNIELMGLGEAINLLHKPDNLQVTVESSNPKYTYDIESGKIDCTDEWDPLGQGTITVSWDGDDNYNEGQVSFSFDVFTPDREIYTIAEFKTLAIGSYTRNWNLLNAHVLYIDDNYMVCADNTGGILIEKPSFMWQDDYPDVQVKQFDIIYDYGFKGTYGLDNGAPVATDFYGGWNPPSKNEPIEPTAFSSSAATQDNICRYIYEMTDVKLSGSAGTYTATLPDGSTFKVYNKFNLDLTTPTLGKTYNVTGVLGYYQKDNIGDGEYEFWPIADFEELQAETTDNVYAKVTSDASLTSGTYLIVYEEGSVAFNGALDVLDASGNIIEVTLNDNKIQGNTVIDAATFTLDVEAGTIQSASGLYIGSTSDENKLLSSNETAYTNTLSIDADGNAEIVASSGTHLRYNSASNQNRFRYFKSASYTGQKAIQLYKLIEPVTLTISSVGYATLFYSNKNLVVPTGVEAYTYKLNDAGDNVVISNTLTANHVIPAGCGVVLKATEGTYEFIESVGAVDAIQDNLLYGLDKGGTTVGPDGTTNYIFYMLSLDKNGENVGFYWKNGGKPFTATAHKAYLAIPKSSDINISSFSFDDLNGIKGIVSDSTTERGEVYTLSGMRMNGNQLPKGIYIVNGKKVVIK